MGFLVYDLIFLAAFCLFIIWFLYKRRKNLQREMKIAFLYRTKIGIKFINYIGDRYKKLLGVLQYVSIVVGYILMLGVLYYAVKVVYSYVKYPILTELVKAPPLAPLIPYFPQIFGVESFFPPFYFTYFIISFLVVAVVHEFSHGIFARYHKVKIKSTGFAFFGPFIGAFVEQDDKQMLKRKKIAQMSILSAGVFANIIVTGISLLVWMGIFYANFTPTGATFDVYSSSVVNVSEISGIGGVAIDNSTPQSMIKVIDNGQYVIIENMSLGNLTRVIVKGNAYLAPIDYLKEQLEEKSEFIMIYNDLPAINAGLKGDIIEIDGKKIRTHDELAEALPSYKPNDSILIKTRYGEQIFEYELVMGEDPNQKGRAVLGIGNTLAGVMQVEYRFAFFKESFTKYNARSELLSFLYYLLFWIFLLNLVVAFFNMLPFAIMDGGRFFYLTIWGITKSEKLAKAFYKWAGVLILMAVVLLMVVWFFRVI